MYKFMFGIREGGWGILVWLDKRQVYDLSDGWIIELFYL